MNDKLLMQIGLIDQITKPLQGITKQVHSAMDAGKSGMRDMVTGGAGLVATGFAIQNALMPAIEMDRKLGEVASLFAGPNEDLEETQKIMGSLQKEALSFSAAYGKSATDFVAASYDIQSAISGLKGNELAEFTKASGILAAATKADTSTITNYMGTMYGIFEKDAAAMGNSDWVNRVAGMTAAAVQIFKTDGNKMSQAFSTLGSSASAMGVDMEEQMAILGTLQATMGGSEAAAKYTAFIKGAVKAQDKLGLSFFDSKGKMLPMVDILQKLQGELGHLSTDAQYAALKDAFGSGEAVKLIQNLQGKTEGLSASIGQLNQQAKLETAEVMAAKMTDQWERLESSWFAIRAAVFGAVLPAFSAVAGSIADGMVYLTAMTDQYPMLTEYLGYAAIGAISLGGIIASLSLVMGIAKMMSAGWSVTLMAINAPLKLLRLSAIAMTAATWLMNAAFWANPITWVIAGIIALAAAVGAMIYWWDDLKASFGDTAVFKFLADTIDWIIDKLNMIPGINIEWRAGEMPQTPQADMANQVTKNIPPMPDVKALEAARPTMDTSVIDYTKPENTPKLNPNVMSYMTNSQTKETKNVRTYGDVYVTTNKPFNFDDLEEASDLNGG
jgi:TP901 family phage tail tape measure protein